MVYYFAYGTHYSPDNVRRILKKEDVKYTTASVEAPFLFVKLRGLKRSKIPYAMLLEGQPEEVPGTLYELTDNQFRNIQRQHDPKLWDDSDVIAETSGGDKKLARAFVLINLDVVKQICADLRKRQGMEIELPKGLQL